MPGSRALKEVTYCNEGRTRQIPGTKEKVGKAIGKSKQYQQTGKKYAGPNYPDKATGIVVPKTSKGI